MKRPAVALVTISLTILAACAGRSARSTSFVDTDSRRPELTVEVQNQNYDPATIHVYLAAAGDDWAVGGHKNVSYVHFDI